MKAIYCPITKANITRLVPAALAAFAVIFAYEYVFHGIVLMDTYMETPALWRTTEDMQAHFSWMLGIQAAFAVLMALFYALFVQTEGLKSGLLFGALLGALFGIAQFGVYSYMPISMALALYWLGGTFVELVLAGAVIGLIYRKK